MNNRIYLVTNSNNLIIEKLVSLFNITTTNSIPINYNFPYLEFQNNQLWLKHINLFGLNLDELYQKIIERNNISNELIVKAHKYNNINNDEILILDLTAGLGRDSLILQRNNFQVVLIEYNLLLIIILNYAKLQGYFKDNTSIINANSYDFLNNFDHSIYNSNKINIYYDPMFKQNKKAKPKKDMQYIELLTNNTETIYTEENIFTSCYNNNYINKIIIKRDNKQGFITNKAKLNYSLKSKLIRFDIYQK